MFVLEPKHVHMNLHAKDKATALQCLVNILVEDQLTTADYLSGLQAREAQGATYLGQGIAIPHGTPQSREYIQQTGIRLAHFPEGVVWDGEHTVYLAVVIAAKSDEHLQVLQMLTRTLSQDISSQIQAATQPEHIISLLQAQPDSLVLHENLIQTQLKAADIDDFFWAASQLLKQQKLVDAGFISQLDPKNLIQIQDSIWTISGQNYVHEAAVSIVKSEQAISIAQGKIQTLICIAQHEQLDTTQFKRLLDLLFQAPIQQQLHTEQNSHEIAKLIGAEIIPDWPKQSIVLANAHGLHARPATQLVNLTKTFKGDIQVAVDGSAFVSAKSLTKLLALGCQYGQTLSFIAEPDTDAVAGLSQIIQAVQQGLGEDVTPITTLPQSKDVLENTVTHHPDVMALTTVQGTAASAGLAFGPVHIIKPKQFQYERFGCNIKAEKEQLEIALHSVKNNIHQLIAKTQAEEIKQIFMAHLEMLDDPDLIAEVHRGLNQNLSAAAAWHDYIEQAAQAQAALKNPLLAERAADLRDIGDKVLSVLCHETVQVEPEQPYILVMHDVGPSDVARLDKDRVAGILTAIGGASAHSAIVARALGIPAVVGAGEQILNLDTDSIVLINGDTGAVEINPSSEQIELAIHTREQQQQYRLEAERHCQEAAITLDQHQVEIAANIGKILDTDQAVAYGAEAIGLLRTELVFMAHAQAPDEITQEREYRHVLDSLAGRPLVVRTLDVGGDKPLPYLPMAAEENPFLGVRGVRLSLRKPQLLRQQLVALIKSADGRALRIMFPMVGRMEEWRAAKKILDEVVAQHPCENLQVGIMIEVPSAALLAPLLAKEVDFFSIGTNDLTQYTLAIDRGHPELSAEADGLHPSILLLIDQTVRAAHTHGKWVGICGELAADAKAVPVLLGLGVDELSMSAVSIPLVKAQIRSLNYVNCQHIAQQALQCESATAVRQLVERNHG